MDERYDMWDLYQNNEWREMVGRCEINSTTDNL